MRINKLVSTIVLFVLGFPLFLNAQSFEWANGMGSNFNVFGKAVATDASGNSYITGYFFGEATFGTTTLNAAVDNIFIAKYDNTGNCIWAKQAGGAGGDYGCSISTDAVGNVYITGYFSESLWNLSSFGNSKDIFIAKYDTDGNFIWAKQAGGTSEDQATGIATDAAGNCYLTGFFQGIATFGTSTLTSSGPQDIFIAKYNNQGNILWVQKNGGSSSDRGNSISIDAANNSYIIGNSNSGTSDSTRTTFIIKFDNIGNQIWLQYIALSSGSETGKISTDTIGNSYITTIINSKSGGGGIYEYFSYIRLSKFDSNGSLVWTQNPGGTFPWGISRSVGGISIDSSGNSYLTGYFSGVSTFGTTTLTSFGGNDVFVTKYDNAGNFSWVKQAGGISNDIGCGISASKSGNVYVTGNIGGNALFRDISLPNMGGFIAKISYPNFNITSPLGSEVWQTNTQHNITWNSNDAGNIKIEITTNNGTNWFTLQNSIAANLGNYNLAVPPFPNSSQCKIKLTSLTYGTTSTSAAFSITNSAAPNLTITSPNTAISWNVGSTNYITWDMTSSVANVKLEYTTDNGTNWTPIVNSMPASSLSYEWTVPNAPSVACRIRISDVTNTTINDVSDALFTIALANITITAPNGGENWITGSSHSITWTVAGTIDNIKLEYTTDNGTNWNSIINSTSSAALAYTWIMPNTPSASCRIRATDVTNTSINDISDAVFTIIIAGITTTSPAGGENWKVLSNKTISWTSAGVSNVNLFYSTNNGVNWTSIIANLTATVGTFSWSVPNIPSTICKVKIEDASDVTISSISNLFSTWQPIVSTQTPSTGQTTQNFGLTNIELSAYILFADAITTTFYPYESPITGTLPTGVGGVCNFYWILSSASISYFNGVISVPLTTLPGISNYTNLVWLKRTNSGDAWTNIGGLVSGGKLTSTIAFDSFSEFAIGILADQMPTVSLTAPNGGETWRAGTTQNVTWTSSNITNVKIEYTTDNGTNWSTLIANTPASAGSYSWLIPSTVSAQCKVRISDVTDTITNDMSNSAFSITAPLTLSDGLVAYYPFNGNAHDESGNGRDGTVNGATLTTDRFGETNKAYLFDGLNGSISLGTWFTYTNFSISMWVKAGQQNGHAVIIDNNHSGTSNWVCQTLTEFATNGYSFAGEPIFYLPTEQWSCLVMKYENGTKTVNVNGQNILQSATTINYANSPNLSLGYWASQNARYWKGSIDNLRIYNRSLTDEEIQSIYHENGWGSITLNSPNGSEHWKVGTTHNITWTAPNSSAISIFYSANNGTTWQSVASNVQASLGSYSWTTPIDSSSLSRIKIVDVTDSSVSDVSNQVFNIYKPVMFSSTKNITLTTSTATFETTNLTLNFAAKSTGMLTVEYYPSESPVPGTLPSGIQKVSQYYWKVIATQAQFLNVYTSAPVTSLMGVNNPLTLCWLKRANPGDAWTNIGGVINGGNLVSTLSFSSFSEFAIGTTDSTNNPLPVELTTFSSRSRGNMVVLTWTTATEQNSSGFDVERSSNAEPWKKVTFINGAGNSNSQKEYTYTDKNVGGGKYKYRLKMIDNDGSSEYSKEIETEVEMPKNYILAQNYPNPFNPVTKINYEIPVAGFVTVRVHDVLGNEVALLYNGEAAPGSYTVDFNASKVPSGTYFYTLKSGSFSKTLKMLVLK